MGFLNAAHPGLAYGNGHMQGAGNKAQFVKLVGDDLFAVNIDPAAKSFGMLRRDYVAGDMPGVWMNGGIYETDVFEGSPTAGDDLAVSESGQLKVLDADAQTPEVCVAQAIAVNDGTLRFKLLV